MAQLSYVCSYCKPLYTDGGLAAAEDSVGRGQAHAEVRRRCRPVARHAERRPAFLAEVGGWLADYRIRLAETVVDGVENAPAAFIGMMRGENIGKMLVRVAGD